ncbi:ubiquitin-protein ligase E3C [Galendromus occidentalis]|uniref:HECT-type E3 ubiquitin transferase n=1 Tax=Galendromus occidentalis TaxID=34638 RepID=A0AAJ7L6J9_9ACAR|nr:ubiquitin-protein ligase E3C [Galendromus occidentalis]
MFSFEGQFRRRPTQALGGASRLNETSRDELLRQKQERRRLREFEKRKEHCVVKIQAVIRGFLARRRVARLSREVFDKAIADGVPIAQIAPLITKFFFFYESPRDDDRLSKLSQTLLIRHKEVLKVISRDDPKAWSKNLSGVLIANLRLLHKNNSSLVLPLRLVEIYACPSSFPLWLYLIKLQYFKIIKHLLETRCPEVDEACLKPPTPLTESLLTLLRKPLESCSNDEEKAIVLHELLQAFFVDNEHRSLDCRVYYILLPMLANCDPKLLPANVLIATNERGGKNSIWKLHAIATIMSRRVPSMSQKDIIDYLSLLRSQMLDVLVSTSVRASDPVERENSDSDSDEEETEMDMEVERNVLERAAVESLWCLLNEEAFIQKVIDSVEALQSADALVSVSCLSYVMQVHMKSNSRRSPLLYRIAFRPPFLRMLWTAVAAFTNEDAVPLLKMISQGVKPSKEQTTSFLPLLIFFCTSFAGLLPTVYEAEFYHEATMEVGAKCNMMPFSLTELASIAIRLRDLALGLVDLAFPGHTQPKEATNEDVNVELWLTLFQSVVRLLHQLYARDCRRKFCDNWIVDLLVIPEQINDTCLKTSYIKRKPFQNSTQRCKDNSADEMSRVQVLETRTATILQELPFVIPFHTRVRIFKHFLEMEHTVNYQNRMRVAQLVQIRRDFLYEDAFRNFGHDSDINIRKHMKVQLINSAGMEEAGLDGGGLTREFLGELLKTSFDINRGFFKTTADNLFYPNPSVHLIVPKSQEHYYFMGKMLGKAIYEFMLVELPLAEFFLSKMLAWHGSDLDIHHLASLDPVLYKNLLFTKSYRGNVEDLDLNFTVVMNDLGEQHTIELKPNGSQIAVTNANRIEYVHLMADFKLNKQIRQQTAAFKSGMAEIVDPHWLRLFDPKELQILISGAKSAMNLADWRKNTVYANGYSDDHPVIENFWRVVQSFDETQQGQLLKFVTSCSRPPLLGFKELQPLFGINRVESTDRLPTAATCVNLLKLPEIEEFDLMKSKLLYAIQSNSGFELS